MRGILPFMEVTPGCAPLEPSLAVVKSWEDPGSPAAEHVTWDTWLNLSRSQFPLCRLGFGNNINSTEVKRINEQINPFN